MHSLQCPKISGNAVVRIVSTKHLIEVLSLLPNRFVPHSPHLVLQAHKRPLQACERGTPQGGVASPLLSNVLLTPFDQEMRRKGYQLTRFADDWVITCKSAAEARAALAAATGILDCANWGKSKLPRNTIQRWNRKRLIAYPARKSIRRFRDRVRMLTRRSALRKTAELIKELNPTSRGWADY